MKTKTTIVAILLAAGLISSRAQDTWTRKADFGGATRYGAIGFSIGSKGYIGTGDYIVGLYKDFWEYDSVSNTWTQKADFGGTVRIGLASFVIGDKGYVGTGSDSANAFRKDFWEYDATMNTWTRKADFGGAPRYEAVGFSIGAKGYIGTGANGGCCPFNFLKDVWEYDPSADTWTKKADFGGGLRGYATGFSIGGKGYIGLGGDVSTLYKDLWEFDPIANMWSQKTDFGGTERSTATGFSIGNKGYVGVGEDANGATDDFWEYEPTMDVWTKKADFRGGARGYATAFAIGSKGYVGTGGNGRTLYKDFWEYTPVDSGGSGPCISPPAGLVSWWSGDKTAGDVQGTNNGVPLKGTSFTKGIVGPGFLFDGVNDSVNIPNSGSLSQPKITVGAWIYETGNENGTRRIVGKDEGFGQIREYGTSIVSINRAEAFVNVPSGIKVITGATLIQQQTWYYIAMTHDGVKLRLYVNGVQDGAVDAVGDSVPSSAPGVIGGDNFSGFPDFFQGIIDEAQIFNRALSKNEILAIYQAGADGQCKPDIFVASIDPTYTTSGHGFRISTSVVIQDENGIATSNATVQLGVQLPSGSVLNFSVKTDQFGQADLSFTAADSGTYQFKVQNVTDPVREYDRALNIETKDTLVIP